MKFSYIALGLLCAVALFACVSAQDESKVHQVTSLTNEDTRDALEIVGKKLAKNGGLSLDTIAKFARGIGFTVKFQKSWDKAAPFKMVQAKIEADTLVSASFTAEHVKFDINPPLVIDLRRGIDFKDLSIKDAPESFSIDKWTYDRETKEWSIPGFKGFSDAINTEKGKKALSLVQKVIDLLILKGYDEKLEEKISSSLESLQEGYDPNLLGEKSLKEKIGLLWEAFTSIFKSEEDEDAFVIKRDVVDPRIYFVLRPTVDITIPLNDVEMVLPASKLTTFNVHLKGGLGSLHYSSVSIQNEDAYLAAGETKAAVNDIVVGRQGASTFKFNLDSVSVDDLKKIATSVDVTESISEGESDAPKRYQDAISLALSKVLGPILFDITGLIDSYQIFPFSFQMHAGLRGHVFGKKFRKPVECLKHADGFLYVKRPGICVKYKHKFGTCDVDGECTRLSAAGGCALENKCICGHKGINECLCVHKHDEATEVCAETVEA